MKKILLIILIIAIALGAGSIISSVVSENNSSEINIGEENVIGQIQEDLPEIAFSGGVDVYSVSGETFIRTGEKGKVGCLNELSSDEYYTFALQVQYNGAGEFAWNEAYVVVDGGEKWYWNPGSLPSGSSTSFHIYNSNMSKLSLGSHEVSWYFDGQLVYADTFMLTRGLDWNQITNMPSDTEVAAYTNPLDLRSPYIPAWLDIPNGVRYTEYMVDFKADYLPRGTYCSLGNWCMDYSALEAKYQKVETDGISAYAGFQNIHDGSKIAIMSFWDVYCTDYSGNVTTIRAEVEYPENPDKAGQFGGEGKGAQCMEAYEWEENHWYRMHIKCYDGTDGTTLVEMYACDLETGVNTLICRYDTLIPDSAFIGPIAVFLENYLTDYAGDVRTLEICNAKYLEEATGQWHEITTGTVSPNGSAGISSYAGSYDYGTTDGIFWMMTTGVGSGQSNTVDNRVNWKN